jgi:ABC-type polysaccharide/polyol phosphate export permease
VYSLVNKGPLLRRVPFPHIVIPLSVVAVALFDLCMSAVAVLAFLLVAGVDPRLSWLAMAPTLVLLTLIVAGVSMLLAALYVRLRDIDQIWGLARQLLFYLSPIFYVVASYPRPVRPVLNASPLAAAFTEMRHAVIDPHAPSLTQVDGGVGRAFLPAAIAAAIFVLGLWVFQRESVDAAENI